MHPELNKILFRPLSPHHLAHGKQWLEENKATIFTNETEWCKRNSHTIRSRKYSTKDIESLMARSMAWHYKMKEDEQKAKQPVKTLQEINDEKEFLRREQALKALNVGDKLKYANSNYYNQHIPTKSLESLREWQASGKHFLLLIGATDASKTFAGVVGMTDWMEFKLYPSSDDGWWNGMFLTARQIGKITQSPLTPEYTKLYKSCTKIRFLMIDELLGKECTPSLKTFIEDVVSEREKNSSLYTIMTSNCTKEELSVSYDDRFMSRIQGDGMIVICPQENLRGTIIVHQ